MNVNAFKAPSFPGTLRAALVAATLWSVALVVAALTLPAYSGDTVSAESTGVVGATSPSATLVEVNGWWGLVLACAPFATSLVVGALLLGRHGRAGTVAALVVVGLLGALTVLSLLSIGVFMAPAVAALGVAVLVALGTPAVGDAPPRAAQTASGRRWWLR